MAFDKGEVKQLEKLFKDFGEVIDQKMDQKFLSYDKKMDQKFLSYDKKIDKKLSVQRFEISKDTKSIIDAKLHPIHEKLDRLFEMESEDVGVCYEDIELIKKELKKLQIKVAKLKAIKQ